MKDGEIRDIPSIRKSLDDLENLKVLRGCMPLLGPVLRLLGADVDRVDEALGRIDALEELASELANLPDRFNDLLASRGWIMYDLLDFEAAKQAVKLAESGDVDGGERVLVRYFDPDTVRWQLQTMNAVKAFRPRMRLATKALFDYREGRYHACVPVVLLLLDGLVNDVHSEKRGFFAEETSLEAWDSIAGHSKGLNALAAILRKGRYKTNTQQITIPYRHGILHGMDLGYDNETVAAKTWAALFATRDWAIKAERGLTAAPPQQPEKSSREILTQLVELADMREKLSKWEPRHVEPEHVPVTGDPDAFEVGTPERMLVEFLYYWWVANYGYMAEYLPDDMGYPAGRLPGLVREEYASKRLKDFQLVEINDLAPSVTEVIVTLTYSEDDRESTRTVAFRLVNEDCEGNPVIRGNEGSRWVPANWRAR